MSRIWLIGGTEESVDCARAITSACLPCTITVTTTGAVSLYPSHPLFKVRVGAMDYPSMERFCLEEKIVAIVDASHPFAREISQLAIAFATTKSLPYLRYERPSIPHPENQRIIELDSFSTLLSGNYLQDQRVLLATGYKTLPLFQSWHDRATLFVRILPHIRSLEVAIAEGFSPERIIALRPPISLELEKALWQQWQITLVVTKANGKAGGENVKIIVAEELDIPLIIIARPNLTYPRQTSNLSELGQWLGNFSGSHIWS